MIVATQDAQTMRRFLAGSKGVLLLVGVLALICFVSAQTVLQVGYSIYKADSGTRIPVGAALFRVSDSSGIVVSEAGVGAATPILRGRVFVDQVGTRMGLALVNANSTSASITFSLLNAVGVEAARKSYTLGANQHLAAYVSDIFPSESVGLRGSLGFESNQPLAAITLRENRNSRNDPVYTTLPVTDLSAAPSTNNVVFPHIVAGGGFFTEVLLMNPTANAMSGTVFFFDSAGQPVSLQSGDQSATGIPYTIGANGMFEAALTAPAVVSGWAMAVPASGSASPSGSVIFQWTVNNQVVSEAGVAATTPTRTARIFVDNAQTQTGVAIVNPSSLTANLTLTLMDRNGNVQDTQSRTLPAGNHLAIFANELFSTVGDGFTGLMEIRSSVEVASITLKLTVNPRGDLVLTTLPVADLTRLSSATTLIFPQIAIGGAFSTRLIFISTDTAAAATGRLSFLQEDGTNMVVPMGGQTGSQFVYNLAAGGGRQFYPGNSARVSAITVIDPATGKPTTEITINEGNTVQPRFRIVDSSGTFRDDFDVALQSLDATVASVDSLGNVQGVSAGFSTLTVSSGGTVTTTAATVVRVNSGVTGLGVQGVVQDLSKRLYLAASSVDAILLSEDLTQTPSTYAGVRGSPGLKDGARLDSLFRNPAFLSFDQAQGTLYVSDSANNVIRKVTPGTLGAVTTLAGNGVAGSLDGPLLQASFTNPQGIALDARGNLWVADSGNHTVRRINLQTGIVETIAGLPGSAGFADGVGSNARFNSLVGLTVENETAVQELDRERQGLPPPPVRVLVADTGNNVIRRVTENGLVETIGAGNSTSIRAATRKSNADNAPVTPILFNAPTAVATDPFGNVFITENSSALVKTLLNTGNVVAAAERRTFAAPSGIAISDSGSLVVADSSRTAQQLVYGPPTISSITPSSISLLPGNVITIHGQNFAPDSVVTIGSFIIADLTVDNSRTITLRAPAFPPGRLPVIVQHRGGLAQNTLIVRAPGLNELPPGYITTFAGGDISAGDGGPATAAPMDTPQALALDQAGNLFLAERLFNRLRKIDALTKVITTVAGTGQGNSSGDGGLATAADIDLPNGLAIDTGGNFLITDSNGQIRRVDAVSKLISTIAGIGGVGVFAGENGLATLARLQNPVAIAVAPNADIYFTDGTASIRKIAGNSGIINTAVGNGTPGFSGNGGPAAQASINLNSFLNIGLTIGPDGSILFTDNVNNAVRKVDGRTGIIATVAGTGSATGPLGDGGLATAALVNYPVSLTLDALGNLLIGQSSRIRKVNAVSGTIQTVAGTGTPGFSGDNGPATRANFSATNAIVADAAGNFFFSDANRIRRVDGRTGIISTIAGTGQPIPPSDGLPANLAALFLPTSVAMDTSGGLLIADELNNKIRRVDLQTGIIATVAGTGVGGFSGENGPATSAMLSTPTGVVADPMGNIFILERDTGRVRMVSAGSGIITTVVATAGIRGFSGDGGPAVLASLNPQSGYNERQIASDAKGNIYLTDAGNNRIRKLDRSSGIITTVAGNGGQGFAGDGGPATLASLNRPMAVALDAAGNLFIADSFNNRIRKVDAQTGVISTVAGGPIGGFSGDGGLATAAKLSVPMAMAFDAAQNLYFCDNNNSRVRRINATSGIITTIAGGSPGFGGDGGPATTGGFRNPGGLAFDTAGNLYVVDAFTHKVRAIRGPIP
jgi:sugar lactone lactonase YvrE